MAKKKSMSRGKRLDITKPVERPRMPFALLARMFIVGSIAVVAAGYAIYRHSYVARPSMLRPVPAAPEPSASDLIPVPELIPIPSASAPP